MENDDFLQFLQYVAEQNERIPKRYIRDIENPCESLNDNEFRMRYR